MHDATSFLMSLSQILQSTDDFVPVVCGRRVLESLHRLEVIVKKWGPPIGNQYFKSIMPDVNVTVCPSCNKVCVLLYYADHLVKIDYADHLVEIEYVGLGGPPDTIKLL